MGVEIRGPDIDIKEQARQMYKDGMLLKDIAKKLGKADGTIRSWKNRYQWDAKNNATLQKKKKEKTQRCKKKKNIPKEVEYVIQNEELTSKEALFCLYYVKSFNATQSYKKAFGSNYNTAMTQGSRMLRKPKIISEINRLKKEKYSQAFLSEEDIFQKYVDIAFSDISDYVNFGTEDIVIGVDDNGNDIVATKSYVRFKEVSEVDGSLINEIKIGKDGASIKLTDKMNALKWLADHMGFATEQQKLSMRETISKIENNKEMLDIAKEKLELERIKVLGIEDNVGQDENIKSFLQATSNNFDNSLFDDFNADEYGKETESNQLIDENTFDYNVSYDNEGDEDGED